MTYKVSFSDLVRRISMMSVQEKEALASRTLAAIESSDFQRLSTESQARHWTVLDLCTAP